MSFFGSEMYFQVFQHSPHVDTYGTMRYGYTCVYFYLPEVDYVCLAKLCSEK